jgi:hypothetical protein
MHGANRMPPIWQDQRHCEPTRPEIQNAWGVLCVAFNSEVNTLMKGRYLSIFSLGDNADRCHFQNLKKTTVFGENFLKSQRVTPRRVVPRKAQFPLTHRHIER